MQSHPTYHVVMPSKPNSSKYCEKNFERKVDKTLRGPQMVEPRADPRRARGERALASCCL